MKVIEKGRPQKGWAIETYCTALGLDNGIGKGGCGAKLLVESGDIFRNPMYDHRTPGSQKYAFQCSECGSLTTLEKVPVPFSLPGWEEWQKQRAALEEAKITFANQAEKTTDLIIDLIKAEMNVEDARPFIKSIIQDLILKPGG